MDRLPSLNKKFKKYRIRRTFKESVEPEEILLDATKPPELDEQKLEVPLSSRIFRIFFSVIAAAFLLIGGPTFYLQFVKGAYYRDLAVHNSTRRYPIFAPRGIIYDKLLKQLVYNVSNFELVLTPQDLPAGRDERDAAIKKVADILGMPVQEILEQIKNFDFKSAEGILIAENLEQGKILLLTSQLDGLPGFRLEENARRQYKFSYSLAHVLGYLGKIDEEDIKNYENYFLTEKIGKEGLELTYEKNLRGEPGERLVEVDTRGKFEREISVTQPQPGQGLVLALDSDLQNKLYESLSNAFSAASKKDGAAAVAINPQTGGILAMVSLPSYDGNLFASGISVEDYNALANDQGKPLFNRAIAGQYPSGSTVKPMVGSAALQEKVVSPSTTIVDSGGLVLGNQYDPQIVYRFGDWKAHGVVDIYTAIAQSCDVYFYTVGGGYGSIQGLGIERLAKYLRLFGFGKKINIDLPGESEGLVPDPDWKQQTKNEQWYTGDTYHVSIGQGDLLVTPLQLAVATAAIFNGGKVIEPHLVDKIIDSDKNTIKIIEPEVLSQNFIETKYLDVIKKGMRQVVTVGTARSLNSLPVSIAAKTGTAQVAGQENYDAWATTVAPYDNPQIVLAILEENAGEGSVEAIPVAKEVLNWYFSR